MEIVFDIDEVIVRFMDALAERLTKTGHVIVPNGSYEIETSPRLDRKQISNAIFQTVRNHDKLQFYDMAREVLKMAFYLSGEKPVKFVTSRPKELAHRTFLLIDRIMRDIPYLIGFSKEKENYLEPGMILVEDRRKTAIKVAEKGATVLLVDKPWNQNASHENIVRINGLHDIIALEKLVFINRGERPANEKRI